MPDSAVNSARQAADTADTADTTNPHRTDAGSASGSASAFVATFASARRPDELDADAKRARAARSAQRLALLSRVPYGAPTLDLFAEDTERATLQALNTDIRQSSLPGFELPEVFMAAVPGTVEDSACASVRAWRTGSLSLAGSVLSNVAVLRDDALAMQTENRMADAATLDLIFDDVAPHDVVAGPVQPEPLDDGAREVAVVVVAGEGSARPSGDS